jgi:hypothetical protein
MRVKRFQFTVRRLIVVVASCAVIFALLRSPVALLLIYFGFILPGFLISRSRGGLGIFGGAFSESAFSALLGIASNLRYDGPRYSSIARAFFGLASAAFSAAAVGFAVGLVLSIVLVLIIELIRVASRAIR